MADGFLGRWSKRKLDVRDGKPVEEPVAPPPAAVPAPAQPPVEQVAAPPPPPTLEEAQALTPASDFSRFTGANVPSDVRNTAMKKLFADPHFNVMDRLDTYIDDYSQPDPIPAAMLRQLASARFLGLFDGEDKARDDAENGACADVAQSGLCNEMPSQPEGARPPASQPPDADPDLRLQQDHAPAGKAAGGSAE